MPLDILAFVRKWTASTLNERSGAPQHFRGLCEAVGVPHRSRSLGRRLHLRKTFGENRRRPGLCGRLEVRILRLGLQVPRRQSHRAYKHRQISHSGDFPNWARHHMIMPERLSRAERSRNMSAVRSRNTQPEIAVRRIVHELGFRFRLHRYDLPGKPDLVFPRHRKIVLVHGCFWHRHEQCSRASTPATRQEFWQQKFATNVERDLRITYELRKLGWQVMVVWQCELRQMDLLRARLRTFLRSHETRDEE